MRTANLYIKQISDFVASLAGIIILSPIFIIIALFIKLTYKGSAFFKQQRLGKNGKVFNIIKFRTMIVNAQQMGDGLTVKSENDTRITKVGKILRATSLDELPQLFNVLKGDMSLVGPRPPVPYHPYKYEEYNDFQRKRFEMKPGMTGLAQVTVRNSVGWDERIVLDNQYVDNFTVWLDIKILFKTFIKVFRSGNVYPGADEKSGAAEA